MAPVAHTFATLGSSLGTWPCITSPDERGPESERPAAAETPMAAAKAALKIKEGFIVCLR